MYFTVVFEMYFSFWSILPPGVSRWPHQ